MLDLDPRVHLHEIELARGRIDDALDGAGVAIADVPAEPHRGLAHAAAQAFGKPRGRALLDQLLVAPLRRAVALAQMQHVVGIGEHLDLDVADVRQVLLDVHRAVAESGLGFARCRLEVRRDIRGPMDDAHAAPAAARDRFQDHGVAELGGDRGSLVGRRDGALRTRRDRHVGLDRHPTGRGLVAHERDDATRGADEGDVVLLAQVGERGVLREEAVAGVDGVGLEALRHVHGELRPQVALARARRPDADRLIGHAHGQRLPVGFGIELDGLDAELATGALHAHRDLAAIRDHQPPDAARAFGGHVGLRA